MMNGKAQPSAAASASAYTLFVELQGRRPSEWNTILATRGLPTGQATEIRRLLEDAHRDTSDLFGFIGPISEQVRLGTVIDNQYVIGPRVGEGGMSAVYSATDQISERPVAIKLLTGHRDHPALTRRIRREVDPISRLDHPNILGFYRYGTWHRTPFLVMKLIEGGSLRQSLDSDTPNTPSQIIRIGEQVARALAYSHDRGIVHRDIKPENILIDSTVDPPRALLADFGIAIAVGARRAARPEDVAFSPSYASPEQVTLTKVDGRSDVYSLGATLLECVAGSPPPSELKLDVTAFEKWAEQSFDALASKLGRRLTRCLLRSCHPLRCRRQQTAAALADHLAEGRIALERA